MQTPLDSAESFPFLLFLPLPLPPLLILEAITILNRWRTDKLLNVCSRPTSPHQATTYPTPAPRPSGIGVKSISRFDVVTFDAVIQGTLGWVPERRGWFSDPGGKACLFAYDLVVG